MRRILFALLVSVITDVAPLALPVSAEAASQPLESVAPSPVGASHRPHHGVSAMLRERHAVAAATLHVLAVAARSLRVSVNGLRAEWQHVAICEVGGNWSMTGPAYSGIGFLNATWSAYGGTRYAPLAGLATRDQQILIGMRVTGGWVPDQYGCSRTGW